MYIQCVYIYIYIYIYVYSCVCVFMVKKVKNFLLKSRTKQESLILPLSFNLVSEVQAEVIRQEKEDGITFLIYLSLLH